MANHTDAIRIGEGIKAVLEDESFQAAVSLTKARIFSEWSSATSFETRESLHAEMTALDRLLESFEELLNEGVIAKVATADISQ